MGPDVGLGPRSSGRRLGQVLSMRLPQRSLGATGTSLQARGALAPCSAQWHVGTVATAVTTAASPELSRGQVDRPTDGRAAATLTAGGGWRMRSPDPRGAQRLSWPRGRARRHPLWALPLSQAAPSPGRGLQLGPCCLPQCMGARQHLSWAQTPRPSDPEVSTRWATVQR